MDIAILSEWNPWWESGKPRKELEGIHRPSYGKLMDSVDVGEITVITGVRRSGKSTLMYQMIGTLLGKGVKPEQILFVNLEDKKLSMSSMDDIYTAYRENMNPGEKAYIFLDEIHRKEEWESWVRKKYDLKTQDKFVISGSCSYLLRKEYSTLLTGRNLTFEVFPLSFPEFLSFSGVEIDGGKAGKGIITEGTRLAIAGSMGKYMKWGGFPEVFFKEEKFRTMLLQQYFDDILYKDIVDRHDLSSQKAKDLAHFLVTNFTGKVSLRGIRNSLGLSYDTTKEYISLFTEAFLVFMVEHFSYSMKEQKTLASKVYCIDNGMRNSVSFRFSRDDGKLAENAVFLELRRRGKDVYYWKSRGEVDFVVKEKDDTLTAINVSYTDEIDEREMKSLLEFRKRFKKTGNELVITKGTEKVENGIRFIPLWKWLLVGP